MLDRPIPCSPWMDFKDRKAWMNSSLHPPNPITDDPEAVDHDALDRSLLETAARIARRIRDTAIPLEGKDDRRTWKIRSPDPEADVRRSRQELASGLVYQGSAGIAFFLAQAGRILDDESLKDAARAGFRYALDFGQDLPESAWGLHSGRVGIAWTVLSSGLQDPSLTDRAWSLLKPMSPSRHPDQGLDMIAGAAGAIPALLDLRQYAESDEQRAFLLSTAEGLGQHLLATAHQEPIGWSWSTLPRSSVRHLVGLAHGTAGIAVALYDLALATQRGDFRFAADMALVYESHFFQAEQDNWPDLRNVPLGELLRGTPRPRLRAMARAGALPKYRPTPMAAWCHGSPGVGLSRLRLWQLTGAPDFLETARAALRSTLRSLGPEAQSMANFSLCHGVFGNAELPLMASRAKAGFDHEEQATLLQTCRSLAAQGRRDHELQPESWPCGTFDGASDPSLMLGEAGIGLFLLRWLRPEVPTPLLIQPHHETTELPEAGYADAARRSIDTFFAGTLHLWNELGTSNGEVLEGIGLDARPGPPEQCPAALVFQRLEQRAGQLPEPYADAFKVEREIYRRTADLKDFTVETTRSLARLSLSELEAALEHDPGSVAFTLGPDDALVITDYDWQAWAAQLSEERASEERAFEDRAPEPDSTATLLKRQNHRLMPRRLESLPAVIVQAAQDPATLRDILNQVAEALAGAADPQALEKIVHRQVIELYRAGILEAHARNLPLAAP